MHLSVNACLPPSKACPAPSHRRGRGPLGANRIRLQVRSRLERLPGYNDAWMATPRRFHGASPQTPFSLRSMADRVQSEIERSENGGLGGTPRKERVAGYSDISPHRRFLGGKPPNPRSRFARWPTECSSESSEARTGVWEEPPGKRAWLLYPGFTVSVSNSGCHCLTWPPAPPTGTSACIPAPSGPCRC